MKTFICILSLLMFALFSLCSWSYAEVYSWVDKNGKLQFSNTTPPAHVKKVKIGKEIGVNQEIRDKKIKNRRIETEEEYEIKQEEIRENNKRAAETRKKQDRIKWETAKKRKKLMAKIWAEKRSINAKIKNYRNKCDSGNRSAKDESDCRYRVKKRYDRVLSTLRRSPNYYFDNRYRIDEETEDMLGNCSWYK